MSKVTERRRQCEMYLNLKYFLIRFALAINCNFLCSVSKRKNQFPSPKIAIIYMQIGIKLNVSSYYGHDLHWMLRHRYTASFRVSANTNAIARTIQSNRYIRTYILRVNSLSCRTCLFFFFFSTQHSARAPHFLITYTCAHSWDLIKRNNNNHAR